jgi:adenine phosphoribosyltransferase
MDLRTYVREVPDFPKPGVSFKDITPLLTDAMAFAQAVERMAEPVATLHPTHVLGLESRGFIFGSALAQKMGLGFVPARKPGKLPLPIFSEAYGLEYGTDALEIHQDSFKPGDRVLIVDDVLATGGTAAAARKLVERAGAQALALTIFIELGFLPGRDKLPDLPIFSVLRY